MEDLFEGQALVRKMELGVQAAQDRETERHPSSHRIAQPCLCGVAVDLAAPFVRCMSLPVRFLFTVKRWKTVATTVCL